MTLSDGVLDAETLATIRTVAEEQKGKNLYAWISASWVLKLLDRIDDLERQTRNANGAVVLSVDVIREAVNPRSWALLEGFLGPETEEATNG